MLLFWNTHHRISGLPTVVLSVLTQFNSRCVEVVETRFTGWFSHRGSRQPVCAVRRSVGTRETDQRTVLLMSSALSSGVDVLWVRPLLLRTHVRTSLVKPERETERVRLPSQRQAATSRDYSLYTCCTLALWGGVMKSWKRRERHVLPTLSVSVLLYRML